MVQFPWFSNLYTELRDTFEEKETVLANDGSGATMVEEICLQPNSKPLFWIPRSTKEIGL